MKKIKSIAMGAVVVISVGSCSQTKSVQQNPGLNKDVATVSSGNWLGCSTVQPNMMGSIDTTKGRGLADNYYLWDNGQTIAVKFLSGSPAIKQKVMNYAKEWESYANVKFDFVESGPANVRVLMNNTDGYWSMLGTLANSREQNRHTLNLDTTGGNFKDERLLRTTVIHEFGHALGLLHEHSSPNANIPWNKELLYTAYGKSQGWTKEQIDAQVFATYKTSYTNGTKYDRASIMHYPISAQETIGGYSQGWNLNFSDGDKELISLLYPKNAARANEVPRFTVSNFSTLNIIPSAERQGLVMYPKFTLKTAGDAAQVIFIAYFYDKDGKPLKDNDDKYNAGGHVATYKIGTIAAGKNIGFNWNVPNDFELFIPYSEFPLPSGTNNVKVLFQVRLYHEKENESKLLYTSGDPISTSFVK